MSKFKRAVCYCLIFNIFFNNLLTSFANTAWASSTMEDIHEAGDPALSPLSPLVQRDKNQDDILDFSRKIPAAQAAIQQHITEEFEEKYTLEGFKLFTATVLTSSTIVGLLALLALEPINSETLFKALGISKLGVGTEDAFYEATGASHWMFFTGAAAYIYIIFKGTLKVQKISIQITKSIASTIKNWWKSFKKNDSEIGETPPENFKSEKEKIDDTKKTLFRKIIAPQAISYGALEVINIVSAFSYSLILVSSLYKIEKHFPHFFNFFSPFLIISLMSDKMMTGTSFIGKIIDQTEEYRDQEAAHIRHSLKNVLETAIAKVKELDPNNPEHQHLLYQHIKSIFPNYIISSELEEVELSSTNSEIDEENTLTMLETFTSPSRKKKPSPRDSIRFSDEDDPTVSSQTNDEDPPIVFETVHETKFNSENEEVPQFTEDNLVEAPASPINHEAFHEFIKHYSMPVEVEHDSKILRGISYSIVILATWGLATVMTQGLEVMSDSPLFKAIFKEEILRSTVLATISGSIAGIWTAFAEKIDIIKALKNIIITPIVEYWSKLSRPFTHYLKLCRSLLYIMILEGTAFAFTYAEMDEYNNSQNERYDNIFSTINQKVPVIKYLGFSALYLFELLSWGQLQDRAYNALWRRGKQATIYSTNLKSHQERLIGLLEVTLKSTDHLNKKGLEELAKLIHPDQDQIVLNKPVNSAPTTFQRIKNWLKKCFSCKRRVYEEDEDERDFLINEQIS